jgi:hypothetical protein
MHREVVGCKRTQSQGMLSSSAVDNAVRMQVIRGIAVLHLMTRL